MSRPEDKITGLLHHPELWRAGQLERSGDTLSSGFPALDQHLPGGGWPRGALAELLLATSGVGELRLLVPHVRTLSQNETRWIVWIDPPFVPYAPAFEALGVDVRKILLIHPRNHQQALWALERASRSGTCSMALAWLDERQLTLKDTRRLQLAARRGRTLAYLFRPREAAEGSSMAELRLQVTPDDIHLNRITVDVRKRRGGWPVSGISLEIDDEPGPEDVHEQLYLWRSVRRRHEETEREDTALPGSRVPEAPAPTQRITH